MTVETSNAKKRRGVGRRVAVGGAAATLALAVGTAVGVAGNGGDERDGRDTTDTPGAPADSDVVIVDVSDGRTGDPEVPPPGSRSAESEPATPPEPITDNGRGGDDPEFGPLARSQEVSDVTGDVLVGEFDTDSGEAPTPMPQPRVADDDGEPVDQDVPGAPSVDEPGTDEPANDADG